MNNPIWGLDWPSVRAQWSLDPTVAHLNHGSFGAVPIPVQKVQDELRLRVEANPMKSLSRSIVEELEASRTSAASFLNAHKDGFVFLPNATTGANTVFANVPLRPGDEVLVSDQVYGAVKFAAERLCKIKRGKLIVTPVPLPEHGSDELVEAIMRGVTRRTRFVIIDHIASPTGLVFPISKIVKELQSHQVQVLVDAAHSPGMVNVNMDSLQPDYWTGNFHKWCCAPRGSAGLWVREDHRKTLHPIIASLYLNEKYPYSFRWLGTDDYTPYLTVPAALEFMSQLGWDRVRNHNRKLARHGRDYLQKALGTEYPLNPKLDEVFEAMTLVRLPQGLVKTEDDSRLLQARIAEHLGIETCPIAWNGHGYLRLSAQAYNAPFEYEKLASGLQSLLDSNMSKGQGQERTEERSSRPRTI